MFMKLKISFAVLLGLISLQSARAQDGDVKKVVETLFNAMQKGDSALARSTFASEVTTATIFRDKSGKTVVQREDGIGDFLKMIGTSHPDVWYEEIWNVKVQIDGDFAQLWCDYAFYLGKNFNHCGVDAFHLYKDTDGWKIFHLADTRRKMPCEIPAEIQAKHK
jgi:hypothetical protein